MILGFGRRHPGPLGHRRCGGRRELSPARQSGGSRINPMSWRSGKTISGRVGTTRGAGRLAALATDPPTAARLSAGRAAKDPVSTKWTCQPINTPPGGDRPTLSLVRRTLTKGVLTAYLAFAPVTCSFGRMALAAGARWAIERCFQETKSQLGLIIRSTGPGTAGTGISRWSWLPMPSSSVVDSGC